MQRTSPWSDGGQSLSWTQVPATTPPNACSQAAGGRMSPSQNPGIAEICRNPLMQPSPAAGSYFACGDIVLAKRARHATPSVGRPAVMQHGL
jgi:hypothetical protein